LRALTVGVHNKIVILTEFPEMPLGLTGLNLDNNILPQSAVAHLSCLTRLEMLSIINSCGQWTDPRNFRMLQQMKSLQTLRMSYWPGGCARFIPPSVAYLYMGVEASRLNQAAVVALHDADMASIAGLPSLRRLGFRYVQPSTFAGFTGLQMVGVGDLHHLNGILELTGLTSLSMRRCKTSPQGLYLPALKTLEITDSPAKMCNVAAMKGLEKLILQVRFEHTFARLAEYLVPLTNLEMLVMPACTGDVDLRHFGTMRHLRRLYFTMQDNPKARSRMTVFDPLLNLDRLEYLGLVFGIGQDVPAAVQRLRALKSLKNLKLVFTGQPTSRMRFLAHLTQLEVLDVRCVEFGGPVGAIPLPRSMASHLKRIDSDKLSAEDWEYFVSKGVMVVNG
jgi:hypothetical protein